MHLDCVIILWDDQIKKQTRESRKVFDLFDLILYVPVNNLSVMLGRVSLG